MTEGESTYIHAVNLFVNQRDLLAGAEAVLIRVTSDNKVYLVEEETERSKALLGIFVQNPLLQRVLPAGLYEFNVVEENGNKIITTCTSVGPSRAADIKMRMIETNKESSLAYHIKVGSDSKFDWINPWNFIKFMGIMVIITGICLYYKVI